MPGPGGKGPPVVPPVHSALRESRLLPDPDLRRFLFPGIQAPELLPGDEPGHLRGSCERSGRKNGRDPAGPYHGRKGMGSLPEILSGKHDLLISYSGYNDNKSHIEVIEGENNPIQIFLDDKPRVPIEIVCNVPDADVYVDDKLFGKISDLNSLSVGEHNLRIIAEGYEEQETDVNVIDTQVKTYNKFVITMKGPEVTFLSDRSNTYINIDNKGFDLFNLNFSKELSFGKHLVTVRAKGENEISSNVNVEGSKRVMISFDNRKIKKSKRIGKV